jgi:hypothetical protein
MIQAVDYIFSQCAATYGAAWDRSLGQAPIADTKTAWLSAIAPFRNSKRRIMWALENMPERAPNPVEFRNLCRAAPMQDAPVLPAPKADPERVAAELAKLGTILTKQESPHSKKDWAHKLKARHVAGDRLSEYQITCYRVALREAA